jgi:hypothetical protein
MALVQLVDRPDTASEATPEAAAQSAPAKKTVKKEAKAKQAVKKEAKAKKPAVKKAVKAKVKKEA